MAGCSPHTFARTACWPALLMLWPAVARCRIDYRNTETECMSSSHLAGPHPHKGLSAERIAALPAVQLSEAGLAALHSHTCAVCLEAFQAGEVARWGLLPLLLPCLCLFARC